MRYRWAEQAVYVIVSGRCILYNVMQQGRLQRFTVQAHLSKDKSHVQRVRYVGLASAPPLAFVSLLRVGIRLAYGLEVDVWIVATHQLEQSLEGRALTRVAERVASI